MFKKKTICISIALSTIVSGCSVWRTYDTSKEIESVSEVQNEIAIMGREAKKEVEQLAPEKPEFGEIVNDFYVDTQSVTSLTAQDVKLPIEFYKEVHIKIPEIPIDIFLTKLFENTGLVIDFPYDEIGKESGGDNQEVEIRSADSSINSGFQNVAGVSPSIPVPNIPAGDYKGTLESILDRVAVYYGIKWEYNPKLQKVYFYEHDTETFYVYSSKKRMSTSSTISTNSSTASSSQDGQSNSGTQSSVKIDDESDNWAELVDTVSSMVGEAGKVAFYKAQGKITVTAPDRVLAQVSDFIDELNSDARTQVVMRMDACTLNISDEKTTSIDLADLNRALTSSVFEELGVSSVELVDSIVGTKPSSTSVKFSGSHDILASLLATFGTVSTCTNQSFIVKNNHTYPLQITSNRTYVKDISTILTETGTSTDIEVGEVSDGVTYRVTPSVMGSNINVELQGTISTVDGIDNYSVSGDEAVTIQLPRTGQKAVYQELILNNGMPQVVTVFEKVNKRATKTGPLSSILWFAGGEQSYINNKEYLIVSLTGYISK